MPGQEMHSHEIVTPKGLITSFLILNIVSGTVGGAMQLVVPLYAMSLQASTAQIGVIRGISGLGMLLLVIPAGFLVDHYGSKKLFLTGSFSGFLSTLALVLAKVPIAMIGLMGLSGLFSSLKMTALNASFFRNLKNMGLEKAGWFKGSMSIGLTFLGPAFGAFLVSVAGYRTIFVLLAALTLIPAALVFFFHSETSHPGPMNELGSVISRQLKEFRHLIAQRTLYLPLLTETLSTSCFATFSTFIVVIAVKILHLQPSAASILMTAEGGIFILTVFAAGPLITRLSQFQLYLLSVTVTSAGLALFSISTTFTFLSFSSVVLGLGLGLINLVTSSRIGKMEGEKGKVVALFSASVGAGISLGPMLGGIIGQYLGTQNIFLTFIPLFLMLVVLAYRTDIKSGQETITVSEEGVVTE
ncbi:MAG: MFS transporter [Oryzomonas sp.]|jgi:MFS family permease